MEMKIVIYLFVPLLVKTVERVLVQTSVVVGLVTRETFVMELPHAHTCRHVTPEDVMEAINACVLRILVEAPA